MTVKYVGMAFLFIFSVFFGNGLAVAEKRRIERSESLVMLIKHIQREIDCFRTPLDKIYASFSCEKKISENFLRDLRSTSLSHALHECGNVFCFKEVSYKSLLAFADFLGKSESADQTARCKYILSLLEADLKKSREDHPKNRKMYSSLSILAGVMVIILMI